MTEDDTLIARVAALALPLGPVTARRMFGGHGLYLDGAMFAIVGDGVLYLKTDAANRARFEAAHCAPFAYERQGRRVRLSFWTLPDGALRDARAFLPWAESARDAARRTKRKTKPKAERRRRRPEP